ncbi:MAG: AbgT family transporter, partial [Lentisphaeria bacterium]|nr:AbgT family transporter [Lentisphaeria bacterium]
MSKDNTTKNRRGILDMVERGGNRLPDPATLFLIGTVIVVVISAIAASQAWTVAQQLPEVATIQVERDGVVVNEQVLDKDGQPRVTWLTTGETYRAKSLLTRDGFFWLVSHLVTNFMGFRPLGVVLVGMLGIGVAERTGLIRALLKAFMAVVPGSLLTPAMVFLGIMSSITLDAGYVVLPPLAAALYLAAGRSPLVGLAAVFAGVAAGFNANLLITGLDPMLAQLSNEGAQVVDATYQVNPGCNWY